MKVQIFLPAGLPADTVARLGGLAENFGVDTLWASSFPGHRDPFLSLSVLARNSQRMRLGVVPISPFENAPDEDLRRVVNLERDVWRTCFTACRWPRKIGHASHWIRAYTSRDRR